MCGGSLMSSRLATRLATVHYVIKWFLSLAITLFLKEIKIAADCRVTEESRLYKKKYIVCIHYVKSKLSNEASRLRVINQIWNTNGSQSFESLNHQITSDWQFFPKCSLWSPFFFTGLTPGKSGHQLIQNCWWCPDYHKMTPRHFAFSKARYFLCWTHQHNSCVFHLRFFWGGGGAVIAAWLTNKNIQQSITPGAWRDFFFCQG